MKNSTSKPRICKMIAAFVVAGTCMGFYGVKATTTVNSITMDDLDSNIRANNHAKSLREDNGGRFLIKTDKAEEAFVAEMAEEIK